MTTTGHPTDELHPESDTCGRRLRSDDTKKCAARRLDGSEYCLVHHPDRYNQIEDNLKTDAFLDFSDSEIEDDLLAELKKLNVIAVDSLPSNPIEIHCKRSVIAAHFNQWCFASPVIFQGACFVQPIDFYKVQFMDLVDFSEAKFSESAEFMINKFTSVVNFVGTTFMKDAGFYSVEFTDIAQFTGTTFFGDLEFLNVRFLERAAARFEEARFLDVNFKAVTFPSGMSLVVLLACVVCGDEYVC